MLISSIIYKLGHVLCTLIISMLVGNEGSSLLLKAIGHIHGVRWPGTKYGFDHSVAYGAAG